MKVRSVAISLALLIALGLGAPGCGQYGPPIRTTDRPEPAADPASDADDDSNKSNDNKSKSKRARP